MAGDQTRRLLSQVNLPLTSQDVIIYLRTSRDKISNGEFTAHGTGWNYLLNKNDTINYRKIVRPATGRLGD